MILPRRESFDFYFLRHGQAHATASGLAAGCNDPCAGLTEQGQKQVREIAVLSRSLENPIGHIVYSPLCRTRDTARIFAQAYGIAPHFLIADSAFAERDYGAWSGKAYSEIYPLLQKGDTPPDGESRTAFHDRIQEGIGRIRNLKSSVLVVSHGGVWQALFDSCDVDNAPWIEEAGFFGVSLKAQAPFLTARALRN